MPETRLAVYTDMRPRVEAERLLELAEVLALGAGRMPKGDAQRWLNSARLRARGGAHASAPQPRTASQWAGVGMSVVDEDAAAEESEPDSS